MSSDTKANTSACIRQLSSMPTGVLEADLEGGETPVQLEGFY